MMPHLRNDSCTPRCGAPGLSTLLLAVLVVAGLAACESGERLAPVSQDPGSATLIGTQGTEQPNDPWAQAMQALERDAWRREIRFREAVSPGYIFSTTRVPQASIDAGTWSNEALFQLGGQLFDLQFTTLVGFGGAETVGLRRFHQGRRGGPDAHRCVTCHRRGGHGGAGFSSDHAYLDGDGDSESSTLERSPISLAGAGYVELLGREMTADLHATRDALLAQAKASGVEARGALITKGVSFGHLTAFPDGNLGKGEIEGVDDDLVIRPFGWKGHESSLRAFVEDELAIHHGMQSTHLVAHGSADQLGGGPADDPDADGVTDEISEGQVTALTLHVAMQPVPTVETPDRDFHQQLYQNGIAQFEALGCGTCHIASLPLNSTRYTLPSRNGGPPVTVDLLEEGAMPRLGKQVDGRVLVPLFSDLKRHQMGPGLAEPRAYRGVNADRFRTPPLWGVQRSRPYLHDGRAVTMEAAVLAHGGEAQEARDAFAAMSVEERAPLRMFLAVMVRARHYEAP